MGLSKVCVLFLISTGLSYLITVCVISGLDLDTHSKLVTLWVNYINNRQFHQGPIKQLLSHNWCYGLGQLLKDLFYINYTCGNMYRHTVHMYAV